VKGKCKNPVTPSKDKTRKPWALRKEKRWKLEKQEQAKPKTSRRKMIKNKGQNKWNRDQKCHTKNQWNKELVLWKNKQDWQTLGKHDENAGEKTQISKIRKKKKRMIVTNTKEIQRLLWEPIFQKIRKSWRNGQISNTYDHPKLNTEDINHLNRSITHNEIEAAIESPKKEKFRTSQILCWIHLIFKELITTLPKLFHEVERKEALPNSFY
jgi:hypothetical protein